MCRFVPFWSRGSDPEVILLHHIYSGKIPFEVKIYVSKNFSTWFHGPDSELLPVLHD